MAIGAKKTCFVIAPIGDDNTDTRKRSDKLFRHIIAPTVRDCGYADPVRGDHIAEPGMITSQVIQRIVQDDLVIADLSERNANVFYELAVRHAIRKPLIQMIAKNEQIPFDVGMMRTIKFDIQDLDNVEETRKELAKQIQHLNQHPEDTDSPLSQTLDILVLKGSVKPEDRTLGQILSGVAEIKSVLLDLKNKPYQPSLYGPAIALSGIPSASEFAAQSRLGDFPIYGSVELHSPSAPSVKAAPPPDEKRK